MYETTYTNFDIKRGDIYYIRGGKNYLTDPDHGTGRPAVVVSNNWLNRSSGYISIVYLTTADKPALATHAKVYCKRESIALCENILTVDKDRVLEYATHCTTQEMQDIDAALANALSLTTTTAKPATTDSSDTIRAERDMYKQMYSDLLNRVLQRG